MRSRRRSLPPIIGRYNPIIAGWALITGVCCPPRFSTHWITYLWWLSTYRLALRRHSLGTAQAR
jgi:hypothetical protein